MKNPNYESWIKSQLEAELTRQSGGIIHSKRFVGDRGYLHFDGRVNIKRLDKSGKTDSSLELLSNTDRVKSHSFLPFLREDHRLRKYRDKPKFTSEGNPRRHNQQYPTVKNRPIMYASHLDASLYSLYSYTLSIKYEELVNREGLSSNIIAYRPVPLNNTGRNKSNIDFAKELYEKITTFDGDAGILMLDVSGFFDTLNHKRLYSKWCFVLGSKILPDDHNAIYRNITNFRYVFTSDAYKALGLDYDALRSMRRDRKAVLCSPTDFNAKIKKSKLIHKNKSGKGIPQGSTISGLLANIYMFDFDSKIKATVEGMDGYYLRYSDDIAILVRPSRLKEIYRKVQELIAIEALRMNTRKTDCFIYRQSSGHYVNAIRQIEPDDTLNLKRYPQYLGFVLSESNLHVRGSTLARRFRGGKAFLLNNDRWKYFALASRKTASRNIPIQIKGLRKKIKPIVNKAQEERKERNKEKFKSPAGVLQ